MENVETFDVHAGPNVEFITNLIRRPKGKPMTPQLLLIPAQFHNFLMSTTLIPVFTMCYRYMKIISKCYEK